MDYSETITDLPARASEIEGGEALAPTPKALHWLGQPSGYGFLFVPSLATTVGW